MSARNVRHRSPIGHYYHSDARQPVDIDAYDDFDVGSDTPSYNISVRVELTRQGALKVQVTWTLPEDDAASPTSPGKDDVTLCTVNWARYTCNVNRTYPHCDVPNDHFDVIRTVQRGLVSKAVKKYSNTKQTYSFHILTCEFDLSFRILCCAFDLSSVF